MAAELVTPTDELTGMPLSLAPPLEWLPRDRPDIANWHHWWHPSSAPALQTLGGQALRNSRVQLVPVGDHNMGSETYHHYYMGPNLPGADDADTQFKLCVLACAGYVPDRVIDLHAEDEPTSRLMTAEERCAFNATPMPQTVGERDIAWYRQKLAGYDPTATPSDADIRQLLEESFHRQALFSRNNFRYGYEPIRSFFENYLISAPMLDVTPRFMKRFLGTRNMQKRTEMGERLLTRASVVSTAGLIKVYRQLHQEGMMSPLMPPVPIELVKYKLGNQRRRQELIPKLAVCLEGVVENMPQAA